MYSTIPTVSIIIPITGPVPYLRETLDSISRQTFKDFEVIIVDDGAEKITLAESIKKYESFFRIKLIANNGSGLVAALNAGINISNGQFIARIDSDDLMHESRLEIQSNYLIENDFVGAVCTQILYIDESGKVLGISKYPTGRIDNSINFTRKCLVAHPSIMFRKAQVEKVNNYRKFATFDKTVFCEDFDLWVRLSKITEIHALNSPLTFYRQHSNQISRKNVELGNIASKFISVTSNGSDSTIEVPLDLRRMINDKNYRKKLFSALNFSDRIYTEMNFLILTKPTGHFSTFLRRAIRRIFS